MNPAAVICSRLASKTARDSSRLAVAQYSAAGLGFLTGVVAARQLGPSEYGAAALVMSFPSLVWSFASLKTISITTRYLSAYRASGQTQAIRAVCKLGYGLDFAVSLLMVGIVAATAHWYSTTILRKPELGILAVVYAASFPLYSLKATALAVLSSWGEFDWQAKFELLDQVLTLVLTTAFLLYGLGVTGVVGAVALAQAVIGIAMLFAADRVLRRNGIASWLTADVRGVGVHYKEFASLLGWNYALTTWSGLLAQVPVIMLGRVRGPDEAGYFRLATTLATASSYMESALGRVTFPMLSVRLATGQASDLGHALRRWSMWIGVPVGLVMCGAIPLSVIVLPLVFGPDYHPMVPAVQVMLLGGAVSAVFFWLSGLYFAMGKVARWAQGHGVMTVAILALAFPVIGQWGFVGLACLITLGKVALTLSMLTPLRLWNRNTG